MARHPRDAFLTLYGRKPVAEALAQDDVPVRRLFVARTARGPAVDLIRRLARARGVEVLDRSPAEVSRISRRPKQDQGVAADVAAPRMGSLEAHLDTEPSARSRLIALDGITTPANVGLILRSATVLGLDGVVLPRRGAPEVGPLVIKASAGVAYRAPILRCPELPEALVDLAAAGYEAFGLADDGPERLPELDVPPRAVFVLGNETDGIGSDVRPLIGRWVRIPMAGPGDSLNVACAATVVAYALAERRSS
ncbi:MAG: TrmH family RNA methyltransferase [Sandaracinaceae bacterium]